MLQKTREEQLRDEYREENYEWLTRTIIITEKKIDWNKSVCGFIPVQIP